MILDEDALYEEPNLDDLRIVPLSSAPTGYASNERHFICFQDQRDANPMWCSEPVPGQARHPKEWLGTEGGVRWDSARSLLVLIDQLVQGAAKEKLSG
jgi:hypothetical protein